MLPNRFKLAWLAFIFPLTWVLLTHPARAAAPENKDVFDLIGMTPQQVASSMERILPNHVKPKLMLAASPWVGLPMTAEHREQFMEALRRAHTGFDYESLERWDALLDLLEEDERVDEALAFLAEREPPDVAGFADRGTLALGQEYALARKAGFLIKSGKKQQAARLLADIRGIKTRMHSWTILIAVDLAMGRSKQAIATLEFLLRETAVDPDSFALLARQQIEIARLTGGMDSLTAADVPPALRAIRLDIFGRSEEAAAVWPAALPSLSSTDMLRLLHLKDFKKTPGFGERVATLLDEPEVTTADKADLIRSFESREMRLDLFFAMKEGHDLVIRELEVASLILPSGMKNDRPDLSAFLARCDRLVEVHPMEPRFHFLRAACVDPGDPSYRTSLVFVAQSGPSDSQIACEAISLLMPICTSAELDQILTQATSFRELSPEQRLSRFRAAELDKRIADMLDEEDFSKPDGNAMSGKIGSYLNLRSQTHEIPPWVVDRVMPILTELCVGSPEKSATDFQSSISGWFTALSRAKVPDDLFIRSARDIAAVIAERKISVPGGDMFQAIPPDVRRAAGISPPTEKPRAMNPDFPPWSIALELFGNPAVMYSLEPFVSFQMTGARLVSPGPNDRAGALGLLATSPWANQVTAATFAVPLAGRDDKALQLAAKLRTVLPAEAERAGVYDALVATSLLPSTDSGVKDLAAKHAASLAAARVWEHPELVAFLYVVGFGKNDESSPNVKQAPDLSPLLMYERESIRWALQMCRRPSHRGQREWREVEALWEQLRPPSATPAATVPQPPPVAEISDYDRLKSLEGAGRGSSEEALTLARTVLDQFVNERKRYPGADINVSIHLLVKAGEFDAYLGQTRERFAKEAWPEADIQRALMRLHSYRIIQPVEAAFPYAQKLFELVPTDDEAARIVFEVALKNKNADTVGRCLAVIASQAGRHFCAMLRNERGGSGLAIEALSLFEGAKATEFISMLVAAPIGGMPNYYDSERESNEPALSVLLDFAVKESPDQVEAVLEWTGLQNSKNESIHLRLAEALKNAGMLEKAVSLLAKRYLSSSTKESTDPLRFEQRQRPGDPASRRIIPIKDLARAGLLEPLAALAVAMEPSNRNRRELTLVRVAARPTMESWKSIVLPALAATPISERDGLRSACLYAATQVDGSEELRVLIAVEEIRSGKSRNDLISFIQPMKLAAALDAADRDELFPVIWKRASEILAAERPDPNRDRFLEEALREMIVAASDPDWKSYLEELRKAKIVVVERFAFSHSALPPEAEVNRLRDVAGVIGELAKPGKAPGPLVLHLVAILGESGDFDADVAGFRPFLFDMENKEDHEQREDKVLASVRRLIELVSGESSAILPVLDVQADERGGCQFRWSLTGDGDTAMPAPRDRHFKQYDGRFDIALLAGPEPRRLSRVAEQPSAPGVGTGHCQIPPGSRFAALMVSERNGSVVHWTDPVAVRTSESWQDLPLPENGENSSGPFDDTPARNFRLDEGAELLLADVPWDGGPHPSFSIWAMGEMQDRGAGSVFIRYIDGADPKQEQSGSEYGNSLVPVTSSPIRQWCKLELPMNKISPPPATTRIQLVYRGPDASRGDNSRELPGRSWVRLAELKVRVPVIPLPKGVEKLGRVPGSICGVAFDAEGKRIALADRDQGVGVYEMDAKTFGGWIPLAETPAKNGTESVQLKIVGNRIYHIDDSAKVRVIDLEKRSSVILNPDSGLSSGFSASSKMAISQDGSFVALSYAISGFGVFHLDEDGKPASRTFTSAAIWNFAFDEEKKVLLAGESNRIWTLPLADWQTAEPQLSAGEVSPPVEKVRAIDWSTGAKLEGRQIHVEKSRSSEWKIFSNGENWAKIIVPEGSLFQAGNERAWLITPEGSLYRIAFGEVGR